MHIIDRYLLRQFIKTFLICLLSLIGLYIVFDAFTNLEHFVRSGKKEGGVVPFMAQYYLYHSILFFDRTSGILALTSAMFTVAWIQRHNELTALMASGISRIRVLIPIIIAVAVVSLFTAANRELVIPRYRNEMARRPQDPAGDQPQPLRKTPYDNQTDVVLGGKSTFADDKRIEKPVFGLPSWLAEYGKQVVADNAYYKPPQGNRPGGYLFEGVSEPRNLDTRPSLFLDGKIVLITPHDAPKWLKPDQCFLCSGVDFDQLTGGDSFKQLSSTGQLIAALHNPSLGFMADVRVAIHARMVQPLLDLTLLFLGLPLVVTRESRNVFLAMGMCVGVTVMFMLVVIGFQWLGGESFIRPSLAVWVPLMLFVPLAVGMSESLWK